MVGAHAQRVRAGRQAGQMARQRERQPAAAARDCRPSTVTASVFIGGSLKTAATRSEPGRW